VPSTATTLTSALGDGRAPYRAVDDEMSGRDPGPDYRPHSKCLHEMSAQSVCTNDLHQREMNRNQTDQRVRTDRARAQIKTTALEKGASV
jgi:hypothetical protein